MKLFKSLFSRTVVITSLIMLQILILIWSIVSLSDKFIYAYIFFMIISAVMVIWIVNQSMDPTLKIPWIIVIMLLPIFGGLFYLFFGVITVPKEELTLINEAEARAKGYFPPSVNYFDEIPDKNIALQFKYIENTIDMPVYKNTLSKFLSPGEVKFSHMLKQLEQAENFIFLEYFIIEQGKMWDTILEVLKRKVSQGVEVRVLFDDAGTINLLPPNYDKTLRDFGIKAVLFNPLKPTLRVAMHNRDHRKILVIDGKVGYVGGINLADEYINAINKHGHWKDSSLFIEGDAVWSLTIMFLTTWSFSTATKEDFNKYKMNLNVLDDGFIQPYGETPYDSEITGEAIYLNIINNATKYVYIETPYFIVDNQILVSLEIAAKRGVDVRIVTPKHGDRVFVHNVTRSHYARLIRSGIKVYEYTPGFMHAKVCVSDDAIATVGTINMDYRSLYHHYECGCLMYKTKAITEILDDFDEIMKVSELITIEECLKIPATTKYLTSIIRIFAPLL